MIEEGVADDDITVHRRIDARYRGQSFELTVPAENWTDAFHAAHLARYGYERRDGEVEAVTLRVEALAPGAGIPAARVAAASQPPEPTSFGRVTWQGERIDVARFDRRSLGEGAVLAGPAIVLEYSSTLWLPPGWRSVTREDGALLLEGRA
jgi:N-methylhydantoinase A